MHTWQIGLDQFKTERPDVDMKLEYAGWGDTTSTILAGAAAGDLPDVFMASDEHVPPVASVGLVLDLNPYIDATPDINVDDFAAGVSRGFNFWGRWWGFPYDQSTWGIYYNKGMFDEAGIGYPPTEGQTQWSLDEFVEAAAALTKPDGEQWGTQINGGQYLNSAFIYSAGGRNYDDDGRECLISSPESASALQWMVDLVYKHKVAPTAAEIGRQRRHQLFRVRSGRHGNERPVVPAIQECGGRIRFRHWLPTHRCPSEHRHRRLRVLLQQRLGISRRGLGVPGQLHQQ